MLLACLFVLRNSRESIRWTATIGMASLCVIVRQKQNTKSRSIAAEIKEKVAYVVVQELADTCYGHSKGRGCIKMHALCPKYVYFSSKLVKCLLVCKKMHQIVVSRADKANESFCLLLLFFGY